MSSILLISRLFLSTSATSKPANNFRNTDAISACCIVFLLFLESRYRLKTSFVSARDFWVCSSKILISWLDSSRVRVIVQGFVVVFLNFRCKNRANKIKHVVIPTPSICFHVMPFFGSWENIKESVNPEMVFG